VPLPAHLWRIGWERHRDWDVTRNYLTSVTQTAGLHLHTAPEPSSGRHPSHWGPAGAYSATGISR
jgi:hypothetical protein